MFNMLGHASVAVWEFFNKRPLDVEEACHGYQESCNTIKKRDFTQFVLYASNKAPPRDKCYEAADVLAMNGYLSWYNSKTDPKMYWDQTICMHRKAPSSTRKNHF
jgi:hypothetical protein